MPTLAAGDVLADRFEVLRPLGAGGLAEVYAARDRSTGREVAVKVLHDHLAHDEKLVERFRREMAAARSLHHPGIVRIFDLHAHRTPDGRARPLLAMELIPGRTLADRIAEGPMPADEARRICRAIAEALQAAHRAGIVHRDLKPQNVMLCDDGSVKLLDFGLARAAGWVRLTAQSTMLGTPSYMAPELLAGEGGDARADLYALGATFFELLTGRPAFDAGDPFEVLRRKGGPAPSLRAVRADASEADDALVRRAMDPDPERRFLDAGQLVRALGGEPPPAAPAPGPRVAAGALDVVVQQGSMASAAPLRKLLNAVGADEPPPDFWRRLRLTGSASLAAGVDRRSAEALTRLSTEHGVPAFVEPSAPVTGLRAWLARAAVPIGALSATAMAGVVALNTWAAMSPVALRGTSWTPAGVAALGGALGVAVALAAGALGWALASRPRPALHKPEGGDPTVWRISEGIARRVRLLRELAAGRGGANAIANDMVAAADRLAEEARALARAAAAVPDPLASADPDAVHAPAGALEARDAAVARLLEIAAALDEVLRQASEVADPAALDAAVASLHSQARFAAEALPQVRAAREAVPAEPRPAIADEGATVAPAARQRSG